MAADGAAIFNITIAIVTAIDDVICTVVYISIQSSTDYIGRLFSLC